QLTVRNSTFSNNSAGYEGGAIAISPQSDSISGLTVNNSTFSNNNSAGYGGGAIALDNTANYYGYSNRSHIVVSNSTIFGNSAVYGGGIYFSLVWDNWAEQSLLTNVTIADNHCIS